MRPVLFFLAGYPIGAYGFFMTLAHLAGIVALLKLAQRARWPLGPFLDLIFAVVVFGLIGARLGYAFNNWGEFKNEPWSLLQLWKGGLSFFGGFLFAFLAFAAVARWRRLPLLETGDLVCPVLPFSLALIRLGCFGEGCCYGAPTTVPWAFIYTRLDGKVPMALLDRPLHPTQLYEAAFLLVLALALALAQRRARLPAGMLATLSIGAYSLFRLFSDSFRGDLDRGFWGISWLAPTQGAAILGILSTCVVLWICRRVERKPA